MESISIWRPRPKAVAPPDARSVHAESAVARLRYRTNAAIEDLDQLIAAADARHRAGTWAPGAAKNRDDHGLLGAAEDAVERHRKRQQRQ